MIHFYDYWALRGNFIFNFTALHVHVVPGLTVLFLGGSDVIPYFDIPFDGILFGFTSL